MSAETDRRARLASEDERLARVALTPLGEPGDPRLARLVARDGCRRSWRDRLRRRDVDLAGLRSRRRRAARGARPRGGSSTRARQRGSASSCPGDDEWPVALRRPRRGRSRSSGLGGPPLGSVGPGPLRARRGRAGRRRRRRVALGHDLRRRRRRRPRRRAWPRSGSHGGLRGGLRHRPGRPPRCARGAGGRRSPCSPAGSTAPTRRPTARCSTTSPTTGLVVSEAAPGCAPTQVRFLARNRLIAALATGTVVVEAAVRSGALNTATGPTGLQPRRDGRARPGDQRPVGGGARADPQPGRVPGHLRGDTCWRPVPPAGHHLQDAPREPGAAARRASTCTAPAGPRRGPADRVRRRAPSIARHRRASSAATARPGARACCEHAGSWTVEEAARPVAATRPGVAASPDSAAGRRTSVHVGRATDRGRRGAGVAPALPEPMLAACADYERHLAAERDLTPHTVRAYLGDLAACSTHAAALGHDRPRRPSTCARCAAGWPTSRPWARPHDDGAAGHRGAGVHGLGARTGRTPADPGAALGSPKAHRTLPAGARPGRGAAAAGRRRRAGRRRQRGRRPRRRGAGAALRHRHPGRRALRARRRRRRPRSAAWCGCSARAARSAPCPTACPPTRRSTAGCDGAARSWPRRGPGAALFLGARGGRGSTSAPCARSCTPGSPTCPARPTSARTACGTPPPPTCSRAAPTCAPSRSCSATRRWPPRRSTPTSPPTGCARPTEQAHPRA